MSTEIQTDTRHTLNSNAGTSTLDSNAGTSTLNSTAGTSSLSDLIFILHNRSEVC